MKRFIKELRRREVFRTAGLYVGICWIVIEVGSVLLPAFDAPEWIFRGAIIAAFAGFPVMLVLAWFFDVNEAGISLQGDDTDTLAPPLGARKSDYAIIGVLVIALIVSLSLNLTGKSVDTVAAEPDPVTVLIARFDVSVAEPVFDDVLAEALAIGLEAAPHIAVADAERPGRVRARDVALQEGAQLILAGSLQADGTGYRITVDAIDAAGGRTAFRITEKADSRDTVLAAMGKLAGEARDELDDATLDNAPADQPQTFVAASLQAAHAYAAGRQAGRNGDLDAAARHYQQATQLDPGLGRAFARLALTEFALGRTDDGAAHWAKFLALSNTVTERERLELLGEYTTDVARDDATAVTVYAELVAKFPADADARARYARASFRQADFSTAVEQARGVLAIFPGDHEQRAQLALYAMYQGDWDIARSEAEQVVAADSDLGTAYLPIAIAALAQGQADAARDAYARMALAKQTRHGASAAELGLADIDLYLGNIDAAQQRLTKGIDIDVAAGKKRMAALKSIALAQSYADQEQFPAATAAAAAALRLDDSIAVTVSAAMIDLRAGLAESVAATADALALQPDANSRAYGQMLIGLVLENAGLQTEAILAMRKATAISDLWLIRFEIGKAYLRAGNPLEAIGELNSARSRRGEAAAAFLDDMPTYRLMAELPYWTGRVEEALNTRAAARASYEAFIALRPNGGVLAEDAKARMEALE